MSREPIRRGARRLRQVNLALIFFNLIPIPPLDGSGVPALFQIDPIGACFRHTVDRLFNLLVPRR